VCDIRNQEPVVVVLGALEAYACTPFGVFGSVVDAYEDGLRICDDADEAFLDGRGAILVLYEAVRGIGVGVEGESGEEVVVAEVVGEGVGFVGCSGDDGEKR
jgi:hypothetical protein